jgi:peroxiredoxin
MKERQVTPDGKLGRAPPDLGIPIGQSAPDVSASDDEGHEVRLLDLVKEHAILVVFYRGGWCPYCNFQIHELTLAYPEFERRHVRPVAISVDAPDQGAKTRATYAIPFPVLSDPDLVVHRAFRVVHHAEDSEVARLKSFGLDIERYSGKTHHEFAVPSLFLVDQHGVVRWAHVDTDYKVRPSPGQILTAIDSAGL